MKNKNIFKIALLVAFVLCAMSLFALTGCAEDSASATDVYVKTADSPRLTYVQGQELDLGNSLLTAVVGGEEIKVAIASDEVKIAGYDKDKLGEQVLTLTYRDLSTTITVNVIPRVTAESYENKYFVGDEFDKEKGKLKIATDKGEYFNVNMKDDKVSLVSFDSSASGNANVTVRYSDGNVTHDCTFSVTVYDPAEVKFSAPNRVDYLSHETVGVDVTGGYFTVTSSDGKLTKRVPLTDKMVSGFDLSKATMANREKALVQELTVEYLGKMFTYDVNVIYSGVSVVNYYASNDLANIDWSKPMSDELVEAARDAITEYYELSETDRELISTEAKNKVAAAGAVAISGLFYMELDAYKHTFTMDANGNVYTPCESYEQTVKDLAKLQNNEEKINVYAKLLRKIEAEFAEVVIKDDVDETKKITVQKQIVVYEESIYTSLVTLLDHLVSVNSQLVKIPDNWTVDTLDQYGTPIVAATMQIYNAIYFENGYASYYTNILSKWRVKNDTFELIYKYFLYVYDNDSNPNDHSDGYTFMATYLFDQMPMPGRLNDWYTAFDSGLDLEQAIAQNKDNQALLYDLSNFMYYYFMALEISEEIKKSENEFWLDIYEVYNIDYMNEKYLYAYTCGYLYHSKGMADSEAYVNLWKKYYDVIKLYKSKTLSATEHKAEIVEMFEAFEALSPTELLGFLNSLHYMYSSLSINGQQVYISVLEYDEDTVFSIFTAVLRDFYLTYMTDAAKPLVLELITAMENCALIGHKATALDAFKESMASLVDAYGKLDKVDQDSFYDYFGTSYDKYLAIYNVLNETKTLTLTANDQTLFANFKTATERFQTVYNRMVELSKQQKLTQEYFAVLYAAFADCTAAYDKILSNGSPDAHIAVYTDEYELMGGEYTVAQTYYTIDNTVVTLMTNSQNGANLTVDGKVHYVTVWDLYNTYGLDKILNTMSDAFYYYVDSDSVTLTKEYVLTLVQTVRNLSVMEARIFAYVSADKVYYSVLDSFLDAVLSNDAAKTAADKLIEIEKAYTAYRLAAESKADEAKAEFVAKMAALEAEYASLAAADKEILGVVYDYYLDIYEELTSDAEA